MKHIGEIIGEPVIGKYYLVPCVLERNDWTPVIGPKHDDREYIGIKDEHLHYDFRFVSKQTWLAWTSSVMGEVNVMARIIFNPGPILNRPMRCKRAMPKFPIQYMHIYGRVCNSPWAGKLEAAYADTTLKCAVCPHRGIPLNGLPDRNGVVVCPGHGLAWDLNTGRMVRRVQKAQAPQ